MADVVRLEVGGNRWKLIFNAKTLKDAVADSGKVFQDLLADPFNGWPYLIKHALKSQDGRITVDRACELIDEWRREYLQRPQAKKKPFVEAFSDLLVDALAAEGWVPEPAKGPEPDSGNSAPEA